MDDEKEGKRNDMQLRIHDISVGSWEKMGQEAASFVNALDNVAQLYDIATCVDKTSNGHILVYYWSHISEQFVSNACHMQSTVSRKKGMTPLQAANDTRMIVQDLYFKDKLFKVTLSRGGGGESVVIVWQWNRQPIYSKRSPFNKLTYNATDHILRNHGKNVATIENGCHFNNATINPTHIFENKFNKTDLYSYIGPDGVMQINFDRCYILNTLKFLLYWADDRTYKYKIELTKDGDTWTTVARHEQKQRWQTMQIQEQFVKAIRFLEGSNTANKSGLHICQFYAFF